MDCEDPWHQRPDIKLTVTLSQLVQRRQAREPMARQPRGVLESPQCWERLQSPLRATTRAARCLWAIPRGHSALILSLFPP